MEIITERLINKVEQINDYLGNKIEQEPSYQDFIQELKSTIVDFQSTKLKIKFVSQFVTLAEQLKQISQQKFTARSFYQFQTVADLSKIDNILEDCDLLCLVRNSQTSISKLDKQLIRRANQKNICQTILNIQRVENENNKTIKGNFSSIHTWLTKQKYYQTKLFFLSLHPENNCDISEQINDYYYFLEKLLLKHERRLELKINRALNKKASQFLSQHKKNIWQQIKYKKKELENQQKYYSQEKADLMLKKNKNKRQKKFKQLKQCIHREKIDIVNPFIPDSLIYRVGELVDRSEVKLFKENQEQYLQLIVNEKDCTQRLSTVVINLCQEELANWVEEKWQEIYQVYDPIKIDNDLNFTQTEPESNNEITFDCNFDLTNFVSLSLLEKSSQTIFDYCFFDSSRFRLAVAIAFGLILYFLTGRFLGFAFLIFQIINFFTGKDVRTKKLKQQTKELKGKSASQYQSLVRFLTDRASSLLILALENINQNHQELIDNLKEESGEQLRQLKQTISLHQDKLNNLKQDEIEILSLLQ
ncbi:MAG: hypothetical protein QNJ34_12030 [Xenococcaceae cyanobacterium MO_188.B29]|nr:hypothetical protein [Xenococcaceae cyanobacterium MO_188.B29]